jgi:L-malate glycosyltransferase
MRYGRADLRRALGRWALSGADLVVANSEAVRQSVLSSERLPASKVLVVPNGVSVPRFTGPRDDAFGSALGLPPAGPVIAVVANLRRYKGVDVFLAAWPEVLRHFPKATALLVGDGPMRQALERCATELGVTGAVRFLGTRRDIPALLSVADLVVHPSLEEGLPNAVLEAMAAGKAVLATSAGGTPEVVLDGETGRLVPAGDPAVLTQGMLWCLRHPGETERYGEAARQRVREHFAVETMVGRHVAIYRQLTERVGPRSGDSGSDGEATRGAGE